MRYYYNRLQKGKKNSYDTNQNKEEQEDSYNVKSVSEILEDKIYQIRGTDATNMIFIRTVEKKDDKYGWIIMNAMKNKECTYEALIAMDSFLRQKNMDSVRGNIKALFVTEYSVSFYGGMEAVLYYNGGCNSVELEKGSELDEDVMILAESQFLETCMQERVGCENEKEKREKYAKGIYAEKKLGINSVSLREPLAIISHSCEYLVRGIRIQLKRSSVIKDYYHIYFPDYRALFVSHWAIPDSCVNSCYEAGWDKLWCYYLESMNLFPNAKIVLNAKEPAYCSESEKDIKGYLEDYASLFSYLQNRTLCYASMGWNVDEIIEKIQIPEELVMKYPDRFEKERYLSYVKSFYNYKYGWYDGNPIHFNRPGRKKIREWAKRYIRDDAVGVATREYKNGNYQEVATVLEYLYAIYPEREDVRCLLADSLEQLAYQTSCTELKNSYLSGAYELRNPEEVIKRSEQFAQRDLSLDYITPEEFLTYLSISFQPEKSEISMDFTFYIQFEFTDIRFFKLHVCNETILYFEVGESVDSQTISLSKEQCIWILRNMGKRRTGELLETKNKELIIKILWLEKSLVCLQEYGGLQVFDRQARSLLVDCKNTFMKYWGEAKRIGNEELIYFEQADASKWTNLYYECLLEEEKMGRITIPMVNREAIFYKAEFFMILYQCLRSLTHQCTESVLHERIVQCISILEPYLDRFAGESAKSTRTIYLNVLDFHVITELLNDWEEHPMDFTTNGMISKCDILVILCKCFLALYYGNDTF